MRIKRDKRHKKTINIYKRVLGFREPYRILVDGSFVQYIIMHKMVLLHRLKSLFHKAKIQLFVTSCILDELKNKGNEYIASYGILQRYERKSCYHHPCVDSVKCITDIVKKNNKGKYFVATDSPAIKERLKEVAHVPLIYFSGANLLISRVDKQKLVETGNSDKHTLGVSKEEKELLEKMIPIQESKETEEDEHDA